MRKILECLRPYRKEILLALLFMVVDVAGEVLQPLLMADIISGGIEKGDMGYILRTGGLMVLVALGAVAAGFGNARFSARAGVGFAANLRDALFRKVQTFSFENIDEFSTASLSIRLTNDVTQMQNLGTMGLRMMARAPMMLPFALIMAVRVNARLTLILGVVIPVLLVALGFLIRRAMPLFVKMQQAVDWVNQVIQENVTNIRVVKSFVSETYEKDKFEKSSAALRDTALQAMRAIIINMPLMMLAMNISTLAVILLGGRSIISGTFSVAEMTKFISYIFQILMSLLVLAMVFVMLTRASASYHRIREVLDAEPTLKDQGKKADARRISGRVEFRDVSFSYNKDQPQPVLSGLSFTVEPGEMVAVIGGTGAGKSSMVQLIPRLYDVSGGQVLLDGVDVQDYPLHALHERIAMVLQKNTLFSGTIRDNLRWGNEHATDQEIERAARAAQAHEFIQAFPRGYDTWLEQGGVNVSGGQKQRLCIARALLKNPKILILDDSTSAVDTATEQRIRAAFREQIQGTTVFLIAQRISSVQDADKILVMDEGKIVGVGKHGELLQSCEAYREICQSQTGEVTA